VTVIYG